MSNATHTPGPWRLHDGMIQCQGKWSDATGDHFDWTYPRVLADVSDDWDQAANGSVMAAAPDLLAACEALLNCIDPARDWKEAKAARAAIAKAKGGAA